MTKPELIEKLKAFMEEGRLKNRAVEQALKMPKNSLSNFLSLKKELPDKWVPRIEKFCAGAVTEINLGELAGKVTTANKISSTKLLNEINEAMPKWTAEIEDYCAQQGILPLDLINSHKTWKQVRNKPEPVEKVKIQDISEQRGYGKPYNPENNPIYRKKMQMKPLK